MFRAAPLSTQFFKTSLMQIGPEVEEAARTCGASWLRMYWKVVLPMLPPTAVTVGLITFLSAVYDISTPVLLYNAGSRPLSILMLEYSFSGARERGAVWVEGRGAARSDGLSLRAAARDSLFLSRSRCRNGRGQNNDGGKRKCCPQ